MAGQTHRLYAVLSKRLDGRKFICGQLSIADFMIWLWIAARKNQGIILGEFLHLKVWFERVGAREAVQKGFKLRSELRSGGRQASGKAAEDARRVLFGRRRALTRCILGFTSSNHR
jgi:hypothetical protein